MRLNSFKILICLLLKFFNIRLIYKILLINLKFVNLNQKFEISLNYFSKNLTKKLFIYQILFIYIIY